MLETVSSTLEKLSVASFFSGVGGIELGFEETGEFSTVYSNEIDKNARITYKKNFSHVNVDDRDIRKVKSEEVPDTDVITGGFPCQAFSIAGYRKGFEDDRGDLFFELLRIIKRKSPRIIFIENVKNMVTHDHGNTFKIILEALSLNGYYLSWKVLNSAEYGGVPQNRERIYIVGFKFYDDFTNYTFPKPIKLEQNVNDIVDYNSKKEEYYYYREGKQPFYKTLEDGIKSKDSIYQWRRKYVRENKSGLIPTLTANMGTGGHNVPIIYTDNGIRKLTPRETFNAQGYPENYKLPDIARSHLYKQAGNSVTVPVIKRIANNIIKSLVAKPKTKLVTPSPDSKYAIIYLEIYGKYSGKSYVIDYFSSKRGMNKSTKEKITTLNPLISEEEYIKLIKKGKSGKFYMYTKI